MMQETLLNPLEQTLADGYAAGKSYRDLGELVGLSHETVRIVLGRLGVPPRSTAIETPDREASAKRIKELRGRMGLSIDKFARFLTDLAEGHRLGIEVAYATIGYWERGDRVPTGLYLKVLELAEDVAADMGRK
jgi:DNA-binding transcriptional regulator YiaG